MKARRTMTGAEQREKAPTTRSVSRAWLRSGLLRNLNWSEMYVLLQVAWNQPVRASEIFGVESRYRSRCLARLVEDGHILKGEDGYTLHPRASEGDEQTWVWLWPLRWHIPLRERVIFILLDEQTKGRRWINRTQLARQLGIHRDTLYESLDRLYAEGLAWPVGKGGRIVCFNHAEELKAETMERLLAHPGYIRDRSEEAAEVQALEMVRSRHGDGQAPTPRWSGPDTRILSGFAKDSPPQGEDREGGGQSPEKTWVHKLSSSLSRQAEALLRSNGATRVPRSLGKEIARLLMKYEVQIPKHFIPSFTREALAFGSTRYMAKELLQDLDGALASAAQQLVRQHQEREGLMVKSLIDLLRSSGRYSVESLLAPDDKGLPYIKVLLSKNPTLSPASWRLDPVLAAAWAQLEQEVTA